MKHIEGNTPKCYECFYYSEIMSGSSIRGCCNNEYNLTHGINGKIRTKPLIQYFTNWNNFCRQWEDLEDRFSYHDCVTGKYREEKVK